jgi:hypothetical protein
MRSFYWNNRVILTLILKAYEHTLAWHGKARVDRRGIDMIDKIRSLCRTSVWLESPQGWCASLSPACCLPTMAEVFNNPSDIDE